MNNQPVKLSPGQSIVFNNFVSGNKRFTTLAAGRRWGKNYVGVVLMINKALTKPRCTSGAVGKTQDTVRRTIFNPMVELLADQFSTREDPTGKNSFTANASDLVIKLSTGSKIIMKGSAQAEAFRGEEIDGMFWADEIDFHYPGATNNFLKDLEEIYRPCTSVTQAPFLFTSTPYGVGMPFHELWLRTDRNPDNNQRFHFTSYDSPMIPDEEIDDARLDMSPTAFAQEYLAEFTSASNRVYPKFGKDNILPVIEDRHMELYVGLDHNVAMTTAVVEQYGDKNEFGQRDIEIIDEITLYNSNTREMAIAIKTRYPDRQIIVCADPSGKARKTSASLGVTDHSILREEGFTVAADNKAPAITDRINNANNIIYNAAGVRRLFVASKCITVIEALSFQLNDEKTNLPMKGGRNNYDDTNDSTTYAFWIMTGDELSNQGSTKAVRSGNFYG